MITDCEDAAIHFWDTSHNDYTSVLSETSGLIYIKGL